MIPFLKSVANAYAGRFSNLSEFCFLFPNKRSGTFFLKYLRERCCSSPMLAPEVKSVAEFVSDLPGLVAASRLDQIFLLYESYCEILGIEEDDFEGAGFDSFRGWGETVLSDFNEVDLYLAPPDEVFKNVKDFREIASNFLTEEQKRVMEEYFGRTETGDPEKFWKNFEGDEESLSDVKKRFLHLWRVMAPLYHSFGEKLSRRGLATTGGLYRQALEVLRDRGREALPYKKVVAVGFNALSTSENAIFAELRDLEPHGGFETYADFFWDATGPVLSAGINSASRFVKSNIRQFPCPQWALPILKESDAEAMPARMRVAASPSNSAQVKIAGEMLAELRKRLPAEEFSNAKVAVVLPDENLLLPMLYSFPQGMGDVNLTMGYPLKLTSVVPYVTLLRRLFRSMRMVSGEKAFYHRDVRLFLAHPFSHACFSTAAVNAINGYLDRHHKAVITLSEIAEFSEDAAGILSRLDSESSPEEVIAFMDALLNRVSESLPKLEGGMVKTRLERAHIDVYRDALRRLGDIFGEYAVKMKPYTVFRLIDSLLSGEKVGFEGEPLTGLQVMGMLETRSIDFDYIFILSANERILPLRSRSKSFIPDTLRVAFGMPPSNYAESIFAYYFYRMISRAKEVTMIYDARSGGGMRSGDVSRYLLQLRHLFAKGALEEEDWKFVLTGKEEHEASVEKTPEIAEKLALFCEAGSGKNLSATTLNTYRECQVRFFYQTVMGINTDPEPSEFIDSISAGNILHDLMMQLYLPEEKRKKYLAKPEVMTKEMIEAILRDKERIMSLVTRTVNRLHFKLSADKLDTPLSGAAKIVAAQIARQAVMVLRHDLALAPFRIFGLEIGEKLHIELPSGKRVNFNFAIDRLDEIDTADGPRARIVDYKTGVMKLEAMDFDEVMCGDYGSEQIFQLFTYAWLLERRGAAIATDALRLEIYNVNRMHTGEEFIPQIAKERVESYGEYSALFGERMAEMIEGIFENERFEAPADDKACKRCMLSTLCRR